MGLGKRRDAHLGAAHQILFLGEGVLDPASELTQAHDVVRMEPAVWHRRDIQIQAGVSAHGIEIYVLEVFQRMRRLLRMEKPSGTNGGVDLGGRENRLFEWIICSKSPMVS